MSSPDRALARLLLARSLRSGAIWGVAFGLVVYSSAVGYKSAYPSVLQRRALALSVGTNHGLMALFGPVRRLEDVGGFTAWRGLGLLAIVGGIWGVLTGARLLRAEEDAGRWELVLTGALDRARAARTGLVAYGGLVALLWACTLAGALAAAGTAGLPVSACPYLAVVLVTPAAMFGAVGLLCGQVFASRRAAASAAGGVFALAYLIRVVALATGHTGAELASPLGWVDRAHPMTGAQPVALVPSVVLIGCCLAATLALAARRDLGSAPVAARDTGRGGERWLGGVAGLAVRQGMPSLLGWGVGLGLVSAVLGLVSRAVAAADRSAGLNGLTERLGAPGQGSAVFVGLSMLALVPAVALAASSASASIRETEASGAADAVLVQPVSRTRWFAVRVGTAALTSVLLGAVVGAALAIATPGVPAGDLFTAGLNAVPVALVVLGAGALAFGVTPRLTAAVTYGLIAWSFLLELLGAMLRAPSWLLDLSLLHHIALAPAVPVDWGTNGVLTALAAVLCLAGWAAFVRRDLAAA